MHMRLLIENIVLNIQNKRSMKKNKIEIWRCYLEMLWNWRKNN